MRLLNRLGLSVGILISVMAYSRAIDFKNFEQYGVEQLYSARTSATSSHTVSGFMTGWSLKAVGGTADFEIKHSTSGGNLSVSSMTVVSSTVYLLNGEAIRQDTSGMVRNPLIHIKRIDTPGTTVYIDITYLAPRAPGAF
jgi:hypothetical protein